MMQLPSLNLLERLALWVLVRSRRTSLVVVKELHWPEVFVAADQRDDVACYVTGGSDEPASHLLERLYHAPAYGEGE
jgi:hypothetical protein